MGAVPSLGHPNGALIPLYRCHSLNHDLIGLAKRPPEQASLH